MAIEKDRNLYIKFKRIHALNNMKTSLEETFFFIDQLRDGFVNEDKEEIEQSKVRINKALESFNREYSKI